MSNPIIEIKDFSQGITVDPFANSGFDMVYECDIHTHPGVLVIQNNLLQIDDDTAFQTNTEYPLWFDNYDDSGSNNILYACGTSGGIYGLLTGTWTLLRAPASSNGQGLKQFGDSLYYAQSAQLGQLQGAPGVPGNWTDAFQAFAVTMSATADRSPMIVFAGSLYIANRHVIAKLESDEITFDNNVFQIEEKYKIRAMVEWNGKIVMATKSDVATTNELIIIWDGISEFAEQIIEVPKPGASALIDYNNYLKAFIGNKIYGFTGSEFEPETIITRGNLQNEGSKTRMIVEPGAIDLWQNRIIFGTMMYTPAESLSGVYTYGRAKDNLPNALCLDFGVATKETKKIRIGALKVFGLYTDRELFHVGYYDEENDEYHVDKISLVSTNTDIAYLITKVFELPGEFGNLVQGVRIDFAKSMSNKVDDNTITVYYRVDDNIDVGDYDSNWTTLGVIDNDPAGNNNQNEMLRGIYKKAKKIQLKFLFRNKSNSTTNSMAIQRIRIY